MSHFNRPKHSLTLRELGRRRRQTGELSMIEAAAVMAGAALLALAAYAGGKFVMDRIHASQFKSEAQLFHTGILDATANDTDFSEETLQTLAQNHAFDSAGGRVSNGGNLGERLHGYDLPGAVNRVFAERGCTGKRVYAGHRKRHDDLGADPDVQ
jgi:hypothetical protein